MEKTKKTKSKVNMKLLTQAVRVYEDRSHPGLAKAKTRGEVSRSTRKIYKQKGTGGARHGAKSAPIFVGGGVAHGPHGIKRILELPRKISKKALSEAFKQKLENEKLFIENKVTSVNKTKEAKALIDKLLGSNTWKNKVLVVLNGEGISAGKFFRNIDRVKVLPARALNVYEVFKVGALLMDTSSASLFELTDVKKVEGKKATKVIKPKIDKKVVSNKKIVKARKGGK